LNEPEIWMCHRNPFDLFTGGTSATFVRKHLSGVKLYMGTLQEAPPEKLAVLARGLRRSGMKVAVECGGTLGFAPLDDTNGEESARIELRKIDRFYRAGGKVDYLDLDGPVRRLLYPRPGGRRKRRGFTSIDRCAGELMDYMRAVKKAHPEIRFFLPTPETFSRLHRLRSDEIFHFLLGDPVTMLHLYPDGTSRVLSMGTDLTAGQQLQVVVPRGTWQGCRLVEGGRFALMGVTVAPGFEYDDYEPGGRAELVGRYPDREALIKLLT